MRERVPMPAVLTAVKTTPAQVLRAFLGVVTVGLLSGCVVLGDRTASETPRYEVIEDLGHDVELRRYGPRLVATATVERSGDWSSRSEAFRLLFDYISGANGGQRKISMTVPVEASRSSEPGSEPGTEIAMTVPVEALTQDLESGDAAFRMRFFFPAEFTEETAPAPNDPRVSVDVVDGVDMAVLRFTGFWNATILKERKRKLAAVVERSGWRAAGPAVEMFYDPPFSVPWLRRNEVAVPVVRP
jgi:hypothetical protein